MAPSLNTLCLIAVAAYALSICYKVLKSANGRFPQLLEFGALTFYVFALHRWTGFPHAQTPFSPSVGLGFLLALQVAVILGILCSQGYHLEPSKAWAWFDLVRPVMIAPLLLLPLLASLDSCGERSNLQNVSFLLLAFQNGFFWRSLFQKIRTREERV